MNLSGSQITKLLVDEIKLWPYSIACWEGGSAANKRNDQFSDVDLVVAVEAGKTEESFARIESLLKKNYTILHQWRVPAPTWHGHGQCFYKLAETPPYFFLDIVIMEENAKQKFFETERHGEPVVFFDKKNFVQSETAATDEFREKRKARLHAIEASFPFFKDLVLKEIARNRPIDTMGFYRTLTNLLIEVLGMKYRPYRYDFGLRYTHIDFPKDVQRDLETSIYVSSMQNIKEKVPAVEVWVHSLVKELKNQP